MKRVYAHTTTKNAPKSNFWTNKWVQYVLKFTGYSLAGIAYLVEAIVWGDHENKRRQRLHACPDCHCSKR